MRVADRLAGWIIDESLSDRTVLAQSTTDFLSTQLEDAKRRLEEHEKKLADYKLAHAGELPTERESNLQVLSNTQMQVQALIQSMNQDHDRRYLLEKAIGELSTPADSTPNVVISGDDPTSVAGGSTGAQLEAARAQLRILELRYKPDHPDVGRMKRIIRDLEAKAQAEALQRPLSPGAEQRPSTPAEAQRMARLKTAQVELEMVDRQLATKQAEEKRPARRDERLPGARRGHRRPRVGDDVADARLRHAQQELPEPAGQAGGLEGGGQHGEPGDWRAVPVPRPGAAARAADQPEPPAAQPDRRARGAGHGASAWWRSSSTATAVSGPTTRW